MTTKQFNCVPRDPTDFQYHELV